MKTLTLSLLLLFVALTTPSSAESVAPPPKEKLQIYLLMGQSNMAGRGVPEKEDLTPNPRVLVFNQSNQWETAVEPVTRYEPNKTPGVGPGLAFGKAMVASNADIVIGLVPCAVGGTPLKRWVRGADLYSNAVARAKAAQAYGTLAGVLWHQGESDAGADTTANSYQDRLAQMIRDFREDVESPHLPFVVGQIGEFNYDRPGNPLPFARVLNKALFTLPQRVPYTACASSHGLADKGDLLHFSAAAQREFGHRYAERMLHLNASASSQKKP